MFVVNKDYQNIQNTLKTHLNTGATELSDNFSTIHNKTLAESCSPRY